MKKLALVLASILLLAGCANTPVSSDINSLVPSSTSDSIAVSSSASTVYDNVVSTDYEELGIGTVFTITYSFDMDTWSALTYDEKLSVVKESWKINSSEYPDTQGKSSDGKIMYHTNMSSYVFYDSQGNSQGNLT